ncbi:MAG: HvfB family MNIO-type RiPP peptide maturase [Candidatus Eutrophobiaceae bacterium]
MPKFPVQGVGLGLRRHFSSAAADQGLSGIDFIEVAPENWIDVGGSYGDHFARVSREFPIVCHGLSLNLGGFAPLDETFLRKVRQFLDRHNVRCYSEHLSYCADDAHLYDLLPIPFTADAVDHVVARIHRVQDAVGRRLAIENVSYYAAPGQNMSELEFIACILEKADCDLLLDVNNIYVNSINHRYDPKEFLLSLPAERIAYAHIAGHYEEAEDLRVDTHGAEVIEPVWSLLETAYEHFGVFPTLLERDFNIPPLPELLAEAGRIGSLQRKWQVAGQASTPSFAHSA